MADNSICDSVLTSIVDDGPCAESGDASADVLRQVRGALGGAFKQCVREWLSSGARSRKRFASLLIAATSGEDWTMGDLVLLARNVRYTSKDRASPFVLSVRALVERHPDWGRDLLRRLILDRRRPISDLLLVLRGTKLDCPELFLRAVKRVATFDDGMSLAGALFDGVADLPPDRDAELRTFLDGSVALFRDEIWIKQTSPSKLVDLARDAVLLAAVLNEQSTYAHVLRTTLAAVGDRLSSAELEVVAVAALVMWKDEVDNVSPWLESETLRVVSKDGLAQRVRKNVEQRLYRTLPRQTQLERQQQWREHARARTKCRTD